MGRLILRLAYLPIVVEQTARAQQATAARRERRSHAVPTPLPPARAA